MLKFVNIAHGNVIIVGTYAGFFIGSLTGSTSLAIFSGLLVPILLNFLLNQSCFEKVRLENHLVPLMVSIGLGIMIEELLSKLFYGGRSVTYPNNIQILKVYSLGGPDCNTGKCRRTGGLRVLNSEVFPGRHLQSGDNPVS